jgi:hypothetical protein
MQHNTTLQPHTPCTVSMKPSPSSLIMSCYVFIRNMDIKTGFRTRSILCQPIRGMRGGGAIIGVIQMLNKIGMWHGFWRCAFVWLILKQLVLRTSPCGRD